MSTAFSCALRVLMCPQCGAPLEVAPGVGALPCKFCGAHAQIGLRDDSLDMVLRPQRQPISEQERIARLRMQAGKPMLPPPAVAHLFQGGGIAPWRLDEAVSVWQGARREVATTGRPDAAEVLYFLALAISGTFGERGDAVRQRAVLESSLELVRLPRHRQALRCTLSRLACRAGDLAAAEQWLMPCDSASDDLEMDGPFRFSRGLIATARRDFQGVLAILGQGPNDVPMLQAVETVCVALRANALEQLGNVQAASAMLIAYMGMSPEHSQRLDKVLDYWKAFGLCTQSRAPAQGVRREQQANAAAASTGGGAGTVFAYLGVIMLVVGLGLFVASFVAGHGGSSAASGRHGHAPVPAAVDGGASMGLRMAGGIVGLMGLIFAGVGFPLKRAADRARRLALTGERATAQIVQARPTGLSINEVPQIELTLLVQRPGGQPPYQATTKILGAGHLAHGMSVPVLVDPQDPSAVILQQG